MKHLLIISMLFWGCSKKEAPKPTTQQYTLSIIGGVFPNLLINGEQQLNINQTFTVKTGDVITITDEGQDSWTPSTGNKNNGHVKLSVIIDNKTVYEVNCFCDANFTKTI